MFDKENKSGQSKKEQAGSRPSVYLVTPSGSSTASQAEKMAAIREKAQQGKLGKLTHFPLK